MVVVQVLALSYCSSHEVDPHLELSVRFVLSYTGPVPSDSALKNGGCAIELQQANAIKSPGVVGLR